MPKKMNEAYRGPLKYIGSGFYVGIPARDLTADEVSKIKPEIISKMILDGNYQAAEVTETRDMEADHE